MADISVTAASVVPATTGVTFERYPAAVAITAGQVCYVDASTGQANLADADSATAAVRTVKGIAVNSCAAGQQVVLQTSGELTFNAVLTKGAPFYCSATAGGIMPQADLTTGKYVHLLGIAKSTTVLVLDINNMDFVI